MGGAVPLYPPGIHLCIASILIMIADFIVNFFDLDQFDCKHQRDVVA